MNTELLIGSILNAVGIVIGGIMGLTLTRQFSTSIQLALRSLMGVFTVYIGLQLTWMSLDRDNFVHALKQFTITILALMLGRIIGRLLRIQKSLNRLGHYASECFAHARPDDPNRFNQGFAICTVLFCAGPLGVLGSVQEGLVGYWQPLAVKTVMDGLAAMGFVCVFGWGVMLAAIPVFAWQGTITLMVARLEPFLREHHLVDSIGSVGGLLIFCVALIVMEIKKLQLADYLPSLIVAPIITWLWP